MQAAIIHTFFFIAVLVINFLANYIPINGVTTGEVSGRFNSLITPAGPAFSIWGIIYLFLLLWIVQVWIGVIKKDGEAINEAKSLIFLFPVSCLMNIGWIFSWHYGYINLSLVLIIGLLLSLIGVYIISSGFKILWRFPFSTYLSWISVATIVNVSVIAIYNEWVLFPNEAVDVTIIMMLVATILGLIMIHKKSDIFYGLIIVWALFFITIKNSEIQSLFYSGIGFQIILLLNLVFIFWLKWKSILKRIN